MSQEIMESKTKNLRDIEDIIARAQKKVGAKGEYDICRYIPMTSGGYIHHFTLKKMKIKKPTELLALIEKYIINNDRPGMVAPKQRAPRGSRKSRDRIVFSRSYIDRMLSIARLAGDKEMVAVLSPKRSLAVCKRELISSIRHNRVETELWNECIEAMNAQQITQAS